MKCITAIQNLIDTPWRNGASHASNTIASIGYGDGMDAAEKEGARNLLGRCT
jgi:hypothetical protein